MKRILFLILAVVLSGNVAAAAPVGSKAIFYNMSAVQPAVKTSAVFSVLGYKTKTLQVTGVTLGSSLSNVTYGTMQGTLVAQCAPSETGPWASCVSNGYAQTAISMTANGAMTWEDASSYVRFQWTAGATGVKLSAWFNYLDN